jgi:hypothetical protein
MKKDESVTPRLQKKNSTKLHLSSIFLSVIPAKEAVAEVDFRFNSHPGLDPGSSFSFLKYF